MRTVMAGILGLVTSICLAQTQEPPPQLPQRSELPPAIQRNQPSTDGGVREVLESIVFPPIPHAPFFATLDTEAVKYSADGATMTFVNERHIARDLSTTRERTSRSPTELILNFASNVTNVLDLQAIRSSGSHDFLRVPCGISPRSLR